MKIDRDMSKTIKSVESHMFTVALIEVVSGYYYIVYSVEDQMVQSEAIKDLGLASFMFDLKLMELEGH